MVKLFFSYKFKSVGETFANKMYFVLKKQSGLKIDFWKYHGKAGEFPPDLRKMIARCDYMIFFWGNEFGNIQIQEVGYALEQRRKIIPILLPNYKKARFLKKNYEILSKLNDKSSIVIEKEKFNKINKSVIEVAKELYINKLNMRKWIPEYFLPDGYPFQYEKDIIGEFIKGKGKLSADRVREGCPSEWPQVDRRLGDTPNTIIEERRGKNRDNKFVMPAALSDYHFKDNHQCLFNLDLTFPEAGPRQFLYYPKKSRALNVGIVVSGGIAPGINSVIAGIVKRHVDYDKKRRSPTTIYGYMEGFKALLGKEEGPRYKVIYTTGEKKEMLEMTVYSKAEEGGSILPTSRADELLSEEDRKKYFEKIMETLRVDRIDILYVIGGDGSMKAAHALQNCIEQSGSDAAVVGVPKTMDNDILWVWQSFGFLSAVEWAKGAIRQIYTEVRSNPRICIMQLFGSDSGFVVTHAALASGVCDMVLIPEQPFSTKKVIDHITDRLEGRFSAGEDGKSPYGIILLAETALPIDSIEYALKVEKTKKAKKHKNSDDDDLTWIEIQSVKDFFGADCRVTGQTPDELRNAGLKIVRNTLIKALKDEKKSYWKTFRVFTNEPRHLIRSIPPSSSDIIFGERLGTLAVDGAMAGFRDFMISQWLTEYAMIPLELVVLGRKRIPRDGIFWKSVIAATGQPSNLV
ncbi:MAG: 6-phosphofructokinase [Desulfobacterales bacterium]